MLETAPVKALLGQAHFENKPETLAIIGAGGTVSSSYSFTNEAIYPSTYNPVDEELTELRQAFQVAGNTSYVSLLAKDSRATSHEDIEFLIDVIDALDNERLIITFGTYGIPELTRILDQNLTKPKIVGVSGALLPSCFKKTDASFNAGGVISAVNAAYTFNGMGKKPMVFASFHGNIYTPRQCKDLPLHPEEAKHTVCLGNNFSQRLPD